MNEAEGQRVSHLASAEPRIETPLRIEAPAWIQQLSLPKRKDEDSREAKLRRMCFSPRVFGNSNIKEYSIKTISANEMSRYLSLAESARRAKKKETEASAHFAIGILRENCGQLKQAAKSYAQYLQLVPTDALGCNALGVNLMLTVCPANIDFGEFRLWTDDPELSPLLKRARTLHSQHKELALKAKDDAGSFVALTNLALSSAALRDPLSAARYFQDALRLAITLNSSSGQCLALGNLGALALHENDLDTAKPCLDQHLELLQANFSDDDSAHKENILNALILLAELALKSDSNQALDLLQRASELASSLGCTALLKRVHLMIGSAHAEKRLPTLFHSILLRENHQS